VSVSDSVPAYYGFTHIPVRFRLAVEAVAQRFELTIEPRARGQRRKRTAAQSTRSVRAKLFDIGAAPDRWGRWKVEEILEVRRTRSGTRGREARGLEMHVRWAGCNPATGLPWKAEWQNMRDDSGWVGNPALREDAHRMERERYGGDVVEAAPAVAQAVCGVKAARRGKRHMTRAWKAAWEAEEGWSAQRRKVHRAIEEDGGAIDVQVEALRDARLRRTGRRLQERRRVVEDSSSDSECERGE
jgi:hypothetical protein